MSNVLSKPATVVYIEYADGTAEIARGEHAAQVMRYIESAQMMAAIHGANYTGKRMEATEPLDLAPKVPA